MKKAKSTLTGQELEIMKVVWKLGTPTVRQVYEQLLEHRKVAYTTVMTMMNILEQKGYLKKRQGDRAFVYTPSRPEKQVIRAMVREFVDRVFNGAAEPLLLHLVEDDQLSREELDEIRRSIPGEKKRS
ncbi:MAG TPA: BlaI/MecI/CopY family transcriptional regulator [Bryobacteraceae bacterium]|jgi:predicted transcriptional regulator|nr:BlaI/MecI/CopY family transcriptional regulator [Bryobacteraceae bacterium]